MVTDRRYRHGDPSRRAGRPSGLALLNQMNEIRESDFVFPGFVRSWRLSPDESKKSGSQVERPET